MQVAPGNPKGPLKRNREAEEEVRVKEGRRCPVVQVKRVEGALSREHGSLQTLERWEDGFCPRAQENTQTALPTPGFAERLSLDFWPLDLEDQPVLAKAAKAGQFVPQQAETDTSTWLWTTHSRLCSKSP